MFCSEYGWTIDMVFNNTKDQIFALAKSIAERKKKDMELDAAIHGAELKGGNTSGKKSLSLEDDLGSLGIHVVEE